jgi:hypothetical protein
MRGELAAKGAPVESAPGVLAVEDRLWFELEPLLLGALETPALLALPVRLVVPSRSLREHLSGALLRRAGRALLGVSVQTLHRLAEEVLERAGEAAPAGADLLPIAIRRLSREEPALRGPLDGLADGYAAIEAVVADLLDAGFEAVHAEAVEELLAQELGSDEAGARARAAVRVAARVAELAGAGVMAHRSALFRRARELLEADPPRALPARAVWIHGYADATGVQTDLLEALVRRRGARALVDRPPDPGRPGEVDPSAVFGERFAARLAQGTAVRASASPAPPAPELRVLRAPGPGAEARAVALELRRLLDAGAVPERLGVVARDLAPYRIPLRLHFGRLGIPFSGLGEPGPAGPAARRLGALADLLREGERAAAERWLEALVALPRPGSGPERPGGDPRALSHLERVDLRRALHRQGIARLADLAALEPAAPPGVLAAATLAARRLLARGLANAAPEPLAARAARLLRCAEEDLGWEPALAEHAALAALLAGCAGSPQGELELDAEEFRLWLGRSLAEAARPPLGGAGAGVQVLSVMEARARCFEQLVLLGMNRGAFPRAVREDPILPDSVRRRLRSLLPDLPVKSEGYDEERFLFAELLSASPRVLLSCAVCDDDGQARPPSPLLERLPLAQQGSVPGLYAPEAADAGATLRPAHEHAVLAGLYGTRARFEEILALALVERRALLDAPALEEPADLARARRAVLEELDAGPGRQRDLGPYLGFVGEAAGPDDPRRAPLYLTTVERAATCPWQAFLTRWLRLAPPADALGAFPSARGALLGTVVHEALQALVVEALGPAAPASLAEAAARAPTPVAWPDEARLEALVARAAERACRRHGIVFPGFARVLALQARPHLEAARALDWAAGAVPALAAEVEGSLAVTDAAGAQRLIHFRADRVDRVGGALRLTDYKTGTGYEKQLKPEQRRKGYLARAARGEGLQAAAYALAARQLESAGSEGRYAFLSPEAPPHARVFAVPEGDADFAQALAASVGAVLEAFDRGSLFPRVVEPDGESEPRSCGYCEVREACLRGDSGARLRLLDFVERAQARRARSEPEASEGPAERALLRLFELPRASS